MLTRLLKLLRYIIAWIDVVFIWLLLYPLSFLPSALCKRFYRPLFRFFSLLIIEALGIELKLHQKNKRALPSQFILISNHPSCVEDAGMVALFKARFLAKAEVEHWWFVGRIAKAAGTLFFNRESKEGRQGASEAISQAIKQGESVGLYPEGGCKGRRIHLPFRYGAFGISFEQNVPILPVFIHYESQDDFEWQNQHLLVKMWQIMMSQNKTANYYVFDAIQPSQFNSKEEYCQAVQDMYLEWQKKYLD